MSEPVTGYQLRQDTFRLLNHVLDTGEPLEIEYKGHRFRLIPGEHVPNRLATIRTNPGVIVGDPDELVSMDWSHESSSSEPSDNSPVEMT